MNIDKSIQRGVNQALYQYLPGQFVEYPGANAVVYINSWGSSDKHLKSKEWILEKIGSRFDAYEDTASKFPDNPEREPDKFSFGKPNMVFAELKPLTFVDPNTDNFYKFNNARQLSSFLDSLDDDALLQKGLVFISNNGGWEPLTPPSDADDVNLEQRGESQSDMMWVDRNDRSQTWDVRGWVEGDAVYGATPVRARRTYLPQLMTVVNIRNFVEADEENKELLGKLVLHRYLNFDQDLERDIPALFERLKDKERTGEERAREMVEELGMDFDELSDEKKRNIIQTSTDSQTEEVAGELNLIEKKFDSGDILSSLGNTYEYVESTNSPKSTTLEEKIDESSGSDKKMYRRFQDSLDNIGVGSVRYSEDIPLLNIAYGYTRAEFEKGETTLRAFPSDRFDNTGSKNKIPIYMTEVETEGIMLEFDRRRIIEFLYEKGVIEEVPEEGEEKEWFIKNVDQNQISTFEGVSEEGVTKEVFKLIHTISHILMSQLPEQCGIGIDQIGERIFPSVPAILIYSSERGEFKLGALKDLFQNNIYPWIDLAFKNSRPKQCVYDPVCFEGEGACHSCLYLNPISCSYFNQELTRHTLFRSQDGEKGFWTDVKGQFG